MQNVLDKQFLPWWPNPQACFTSKIQNVGQAMLVHLAAAQQSSNLHGASLQSNVGSSF